MTAELINSTPRRHRVRREYIPALCSPSLRGDVLVQALKFLAVGLLNTLVDASLYFILTRWLGFAVLNVLAKSLSYSAGVLNSYYWNKTWTFKSSARTLKTLLPFVFASLIALAINAAVMHMTLKVASLPEALAFLLATGVTFLWNFVISKFSIFRE